MSALEASLELLASITVGIMVYVGHKHAVRSSALVALYLIFTFFNDIRRSRLFFLQPGLSVFGNLAAGSAALRLYLLVLEEMPKKILLAPAGTPDLQILGVSTGYFSRVLSCYLNPVVVAGFYRQLGPQDIGDLDPEFSSQVLHERLKRQWVRRSSNKSRHRLLLSCLGTWKWEILQIMAVRLVNIGCLLGQPILMEEIIKVVEIRRHPDNHIPLLKRFDLQGATVLVFVGVAVSRTAAAYLSNRLTAKVRGGLIALMMEKIHHICEQDAQNSELLTNLSTDIEIVIEELSACIDVPMLFLETSIGILFLSRFIGKTCFFAVLPAAGNTLCSFFLGRGTVPALVNWTEKTKTRVAKTTEVLKQLPGIKMLGLGPVVRDYIQRLRVEEMQAAMPYRYFMGLLNMLEQFADLGTPAIVIGAAFVSGGFNGKLDPTRVYPVLAGVRLVQAPTNKGVMAYSSVAQLVASLGRFQEFLLLPEQTDSRVRWDPSASLDTFDEVLTDGGSVRRTPNSPAHSPVGIIQFVNASIGFAGVEEALLSGINFVLSRGSVSGIVGATGCGKTTFLRSILGAAKTFGGFVYVDRTAIAYCGSTVWLRDVSIRENIVGYLPFDPVRYEIAIQSCQLVDDFARLPKGDEYIVGPGGLNLSGGQRQRVSLARAVFSRCKITIIDDALNSLDGTTAVAVLQALCGVDGVLRRSGSTVLLSTYLPEVLNVVDQVITLNNQGQVSLDRSSFRSPGQYQTLANVLVSAMPVIRDGAENKEKAAIRRLQSLDIKKVYPQASYDGKHDNDWRMYVVFIESIGKFKFLWLLVLGALLPLSEFLPEFHIRDWTDYAPNDASWLTHYYLLIGLACALVTVSYWLLYNYFAFRAATKLHEEILDTTMRATLGFLTTTKTADILTMFDEDARNCARMLPYHFFRTLYQGFSTFVIWIPEDTSGSVVGMSLLNLFTIQSIFQFFILAWTGSEMSVAVLKKMERFKRTTPQEPTRPPPEDLPEGWPLAGDVELSNVSARYREARDVPPVIRDVSLIIEPGERISFVGRSSSGKTSLMLTLLGFLQYSGVVEIDGVDIDTVTPDFLRSRVITMTQDAVQFNDTIRRNLIPFDMNEEEKDDELAVRQRARRDTMLTHVLQQLNIWNKLSDKGGLDAMLQDVGYSKGEMQLLSVARGTVRRLETGINLIMMDEATSNLDPLRDDATHQFMEQTFQGCTVIIISHRQEVIQTTDCALRLNEGELINVEIPNNPLTWLGAPLPTLPESEMEESGFDFEGGSGSASSPVVIP
ncbi:ABC multidrug transporter [Akanthomyces lecanii RCEF 1005]|uniref:ABC multidrug transporter n=1 Tax=Akanthomyces lecanii RCEF 1005 TaxID=1081108 RepID=A0A168J8J9_CORDF|nr:ABC multidrug transporter [Akanthomyces lecanii RCEF 1005]